MVNIKAQEMSIQTVVVVILILIVLVVVIAFSVPQLTGIFGGLATVTNETSSQLPTNIDLAPKACYPVSANTPGSPGVTLPTGCTVAMCSGKSNQFDCLSATNGTIGYNCCKWANVN